MGGKAHGGRRITRVEADELFNLIRRDLHAPYLGGNPHLEISTLALCGSYRRGKKECGDLDIVALVHEKDGFDTWCVEHFGMQKSGKKPALNGLIDGVQVEFYVANDKNLGTFLQMWTGSMRHNIQLRGRAKKMGYSMSQYGFKSLKTGEMTTFDSERGVYEFLEMDFVLPEDR